MPKDLFKKALKASLTGLLEIEVTALCNPADGERTVGRDDSARVAACAPEDVLPAPAGAPAHLGAGIRAGRGGARRVGRLDANGGPERPYPSLRLDALNGKVRKCDRTVSGGERRDGGPWGDGAVMKGLPAEPRGQRAGRRTEDNLSRPFGTLRRDSRGAERIDLPAAQGARPAHRGGSASAKRPGLGRGSPPDGVVTTDDGSDPRALREGGKSSILSPLSRRPPTPLGKAQLAKAPASE
jgi:hypothetical protein